MLYSLAAIPILNARCVEFVVKPTKPKIPSHKLRYRISKLVVESWEPRHDLCLLEFELFQKLTQARSNRRFITLR